MDVLETVRDVAGSIGCIELLHATPRPYENSVATALTCYSSRLITTAEVSGGEKADAKRDRVAERTYRAGHNTTLQHNSFQFALHGVSRYLLWTFLHDHPFYNSEQVSQRYVKVTDKVFIPPLSQKGREIFLSAARGAAETYAKLIPLLSVPAEQSYISLFPGRKRSLDAEGDRGKWRRDITKKSQEVARYVLPIATMAHLHHTVSGLTIHRYRRASRVLEAGAEVQLLIDGMSREVEKHDPLFFRYAEDPMPLEETPEYKILAEINEGEARLAPTTNLYAVGGATNLSTMSHRATLSDDGIDSWISEFDERLGNRTSALLDFSGDAESTLARSVRSVLGLSAAALDDNEAIELALNPAKNAHLSDSLNLTSHGKISKTLVHPHFTFAKKLSLSADSQDQRHRCVPGSRPLLRRQFRPNVPDYVVPALVTKSSEAEDVYHSYMQRLWSTMEQLLNDGENIDSVLYLLPNAFPVRFEESGDLLSLRHKWAMRLCYNAQEEIWRASCDEVEQVRNRFPRIGKWMLPPCGLRLTAGATPVCPEGAAYCGVRVWKLDLSEYERVL